MRAAATNPWAGFVGRRLVGLVFVLAALVVAVFLMVQLIPGDPIENSLGTEAPRAQVDALRHELGLDKPAFEQFTSYVDRLAHGNLGVVFSTREPVGQLIRERVGTSLQLAGAAFFLVLTLSIPIGILAAALTREGRFPRLEVGFVGITSVLGSIPDYLMATFLAFFFAVQFRLLPVAGSGSFSTLVLPALAVSIHSTATLSRIVRVETLNVLAQDYIRTARSKRLPSAVIYLRHALPNILTAALTVSGLIFASIVGGAVIVENVFARPGLGSALVDAVLRKEYAVIQGITLLLGLTVVLVNMIIDILLGIIDPRSLARTG